MARGTLRVGALAGVDVHLHWTLPLGVLFFTGFRWDPLGWVCMVALILAHELGHALAVKAVGARPLRIEVSGFGGLCFWQGDVTPVGRAVIAWGGPGAQLLLLLLAWAGVAALGMPREPTAWVVVSMLLGANTWMMLFNLVPIAPLDGAEAWRLPVLLGRAARRRLRSAPVVSAEAQAAQLDAAFDAGKRSDEVKSLVSDLLADARKGEDR